MAGRLRAFGALISLVMVGSAHGAVAGDSRGELMKLPPVHIALTHQALLPNRPKPRIAFLPSSDNRTTPSVIDQAINILTKRNFDVLDRENIGRIIKEQRFHGGELVDLDQQVQLGKIMGVTDLVIVNAETLAGGSCKITSKAIDITSARVLRLVKDTYPDQKNAGKALAGFFTDWNEVYDLPFVPCTALETGEFDSLSDTYQLVVDAYQKSAQLDALTQAASNRGSAGGKHVYKAAGNTVFSVKAWSSEPDDSPKRNAYQVYEAYLEYQIGILYIRQDKIDVALTHLEQADIKLDKSYSDSADELARAITAAKRVAQRLKTEREAADE